MGSAANRKRKNWQKKGGKKAGKAETKFFKAFYTEFRDSNYTIVSKPKDFDNIYVDVKLNKKVLSEIYNPKREWKHGIRPDYAIKNNKSGKTLYIEVKRQDGWVKGKSRSAGRGNVHERSCKYFTPGLLKVLRKKGKLGGRVLPFWTVFQGDITKDPCRVREVTLWYIDHPEHFFMWRDTKDNEALISHFNRNLKRLLK